MKQLLLFVSLFTACSAFAQVPANDNCTGAITIACNSTVSGNTTNATNDAIPAVSCGSLTAGAFRAVWYKIIPTVSGPLKLSTCGTGWDTYIRVYQGNCGSFTNCVQFNDDYCAPASELIFNATMGATYYILLGGYYDDSYGNFSLTAQCDACIPPSGVSATNITMTSADINWGTTGNYIVEFGFAGFTPGTGSLPGPTGSLGVMNVNASPLNLQLLNPDTDYDVYMRKDCGDNNFSVNSPVLSFSTTGLPPQNDVCTEAMLISPTPVTYSTDNATESESPSSCSGFISPDAKDVWFKFSAPHFANGQVQTLTVTVTNSNGLDPVLEIFTGSCSSKYQVSCSDTSGYNGTESISFYSNVYDTTYLVRVYGYNGGEGNFDISFCPGKMNISASATNFCNNSSITLTGDVPDASYQWFRNFSPVAGQNSTLTITAPGTYQAIATKGNCEMISNQVEIYPDMVEPSLGGTGVYNEFESVNVGIPLTEVSQDYTWRKSGGGIVHGPLNGNGSNQSFQFSMAPTYTGIYVVESTRQGCNSVYSNNVPVYFGGITGLKLDNCPYNTVKFSWDDYQNPVKLFRYEISEASFPSGNGTETMNTNITVNNLQPNSQYYIHVCGASFSSLNQSSYSFTQSIWYTIPFTTQSAAPAGDTEWLGTADTDWFNDANWRCNVVPGVNSSVVIPSGRPRYPFINVNTTVQSITVRTGATVTVRPGVILTVKN